MRLLLLWGLATGLMAGEKVSGYLENGTHGAAGSADRVQLVRLGRGMEVVQSLENVSGAFEMELPTSSEQGNYLIQAVKGEAIYSERVSPGQTSLSITVYDLDDSLEIQATIGSLALYAYEESIDIGVFYNLDNLGEPPKTLENSAGTFSFPLIEGYRELEASTRRGEMPLRQNLEIGNGRATIGYPLKPGRTQLMVRSIHNYDAGSENSFTLPLLASQDFMHVLVLPSRLSIEGEGLEFISKDERDDVALFQWRRQPDQTELTITMRGKPAPQRGQTGNNASASDSRGSNMKIEDRPNPLHPYRWYIIAGVLLIFSGFSWLGYRNP